MNFHKEQDFKVNEADTCHMVKFLYSKNNPDKTNTIQLACHVDDILYFTEDKAAAESQLLKLNARFGKGHQGSAEWFLKIQIKQCPEYWSRYAGIWVDPAWPLGFLGAKLSEDSHRLGKIKEVL